MEWTQSFTLDDASANPDTLPAAAEAAEHWPQSTTEFEALVDAHQDELLNFAFCRLHNLADAEDIVQDVLVQAYVEREKHKKIARVRPYLYRMVSNRCTDVLRKRRRSWRLLNRVGAQDLPAAQDPEPAPVEGSLRRRQIEELFSKLPSRQAEVMRLRVFAGLPFRAIAEAVGASVPTIKSRFRYGAERLRSILSKEAER